MVTINGVEYNEDDFTDQQKYILSQVKDLESKIARLSFEVDQLNVAKMAFSNLIAESLESNDDANPDN